MKKEKEKKGIFNPADYNYMDSMPFEGWIWEFIRRNLEYRTLYSEVKKPESERDPYYRKYFDFLLRDFGMEATRDFEPIHPLPKKHFLTSQLSGISKEIKTKHMRTRNVTEGLPNPYIKYNEFKQYKPIILRKQIVTAYKFNNYMLNRYKQLIEKTPFQHLGKVYNDVDFIQCCVPVMTNILSPTGIEDTLYLGISMSAKREDIKKEVNKIIKQNIKPSKIKLAKTPIKEETPLVKKNVKKWKIYFIVYDLIESGLSYKKATNLLLEHTREQRNIENYYKFAKELINGGYKKHLPVYQYSSK